MLFASLLAATSVAAIFFGDGNFMLKQWWLVAVKQGGDKDYGGPTVASMVAVTSSVLVHRCQWRRGVDGGGRQSVNTSCNCGAFLNGNKGGKDSFVAKQWSWKRKLQY